MEKMKNLCIIQARMNSTRLPNKVLMEVKGMPLLEYEIKRIKLAKKIDKIVVASSTNPSDGKIEKLCGKIGIDCFRGSEEDVLDRYWQCAKKYPRFSAIIRITGDCPLVDPAVIDETVSFFEANNFDFASNAMPGKETFPDGLDVEIFKREALEEAAAKAELPSHREHVDEYMLKNNKFHKGNLTASYDWSHFRLTVDTEEDFEVIKFLIERCKTNDGYLNYISFLTKNPGVMFKSMRLKRNESGTSRSLIKDRLFLKNRLKNKSRI